MTTLMQALFEIQQDPPELLKNSKNPHFKNKYISLDAVLAAILPELHTRGILLLQPVIEINGQPALRTTLLHVESGEAYTAEMLLVLDRESPQGQGSAITYARRYSILTLLGLNADEDDDAEAATAARKPKAKTKSNGRAVVVEVDDLDAERPW